MPYTTVDSPTDTMLHAVTHAVTPAARGFRRCDVFAACGSAPDVNRPPSSSRTQLLGDASAEPHDRMSTTGVQQLRDGTSHLVRAADGQDGLPAVECLVVNSEEVLVVTELLYGAQDTSGVTVLVAVDVQDPGSFWSVQNLGLGDSDARVLQLPTRVDCRLLVRQDCGDLVHGAMPEDIDICLRHDHSGLP